MSQSAGQVRIDTSAEEATDGTKEEPTGREEVRPEREAELSLDQKFELLKNQRRRRILRYLMTEGEAATTGELAEHVAALENDTDVASLSSQERKAAYVGLYQCHLPKMDDYGVVDFDQARGTIELNELAYQLEPNLLEQSRERWWLRYSGVAVLGGVAYGLSLIGGLEALSPLVVTGVIAAILLCASFQYRADRDETSDR